MSNLGYLNKMPTSTSQLNYKVKRKKISVTFMKHNSKNKISYLVFYSQMTGKLMKFHGFLTLKDFGKYYRNVALPMLYINTKV